MNFPRLGEAPECDIALSLSLQVENCKASPHCETHFWFRYHEIEIQTHNFVYFYINNAYLTMDLIYIKTKVII